MRIEPAEDVAPAAGSPAGLALAQLADDVARALSSYASALRRGGIQPSPVPGKGAKAAKLPASAGKPRGLGPHQQACLALKELDAENGASNAKLSVLLGFNGPNTSALTKRLAVTGHLVAIPDERPVRYRRG